MPQQPTQPPPPEVLEALAQESLPWTNRQGNILAVCITLTAVCWVTMVARLWTRFFVIKQPWWDDLFALIAVLAFTLFSVAICVDTTFGLGKHVVLISPEDLSNALLCQYVFGIGYALSIATIKMALLLQYLLVFEEGTWTYRFAQLLLVLVSLWGFSFTFISIFPCFPSPSAFWEMTMKGCYGYASPNLNVMINTVKGHAGSNFFLDVLVFLLAIRLQFLSDVQSTRRAMTILLFMGLLSCSFALWRLIDIAKTGGGVGTDPTYNEAGPGLLSVAEVYTAASCATLPFFWPVVRDQWNKIFVQYEFKVTESRVPDEEIELANTGSLPAGSGRDGTRSAGSLSGKGKTKPSYADFFSQEQAVGFGASKKGILSGTTSTAVSER